MNRTRTAPLTAAALVPSLWLLGTVALLLVCLSNELATAQTRQPGVGFRLSTGAVSYAGEGAEGCSPATMDLSAHPFEVDPWNGEPAKMEKRYGKCWAYGAQGPHSSDYRNYLAMDFIARTARWNPDYDKWDGVPTQEEVYDAYYTKNRQVLPLTAGSGGGRRPPTEPPPAATPAPTAQPTPTATPAPAPAPTPAPAATPCPATTPQPPAPAYVAMPAEHRLTFLSAPYWKKPYTPERKKAINAAADWVKAHPGGWFVPQVGSTGIGATTTIEPCTKVGVTREGLARWDCGDGRVVEVAP